MGFSSPPCWAPTPYTRSLVFLRPGCQKWMMHVVIPPQGPSGSSFRSLLTFMSVKAWDSSICWLKDAHPKPNQPYFSIPRQSDVILNPVRCLRWPHHICWRIPSVLESSVPSVLPEGPHLKYWQFLGPLLCLPESSPVSSMSFLLLDHFTQQNTEATVSGYSLLGPPYTDSRGRVELTSVLRFKVPPVFPQGPCLDSWQVLELLSLLIWRHIPLSKPHFPETFIFYFPRRKSEASMSLWLGTYGGWLQGQGKAGTPLFQSGRFLHCSFNILTLTCDRAWDSFLLWACPLPAKALTSLMTPRAYRGRLTVWQLCQGSPTAVIRSRAGLSGPSGRMPRLSPHFWGPGSLMKSWLGEAPHCQLQAFVQLHPL